jgi:hypothetical protein
MVRNVHGMKEKARRHTVTMTSPYTWSVHSGYSGNDYTVGQLADGRYLCNCEWGRNYPCEECSHIIAAKDNLRDAAKRVADLLVAAFLGV